MKNWLLHLLLRRSAAFTPLQLSPAPLASQTKMLSTLKRHQCRAAPTLLLLSLGWVALAADLPLLCADRAAIERVYYNHRLGEKPPFEQVLPPATLENLVRQDLCKEAALKKTYGVEVTPAMLDAEVQRINTTTRAPEMLAEIKAALGHDPARFARAMAKPILVERRLREKFANDDVLHASQRREMERVREKLIKTWRQASSPAVEPGVPPGGQTANIARPVEKSGAGPGGGTPPSTAGETPAATNDLVAKLLALLKQTHSNDVSETTWQLAARPAETNAPAADEIEIKERFGPNAQILSSPPGGGKDQKFYFEDLPGELQNVLRVQLRQAGDVSAVIETPGGFLLYVAKEKTDAVLSVAGLSLPKRSYEQWLTDQGKGAK